MRWILAVCLSAAAANAGEYAVLTSGFRLHADRHERTGDTVALVSGGGRIEIPAGEIVRFEAEETAAPAPAAAPPAIVPPADPKALVKQAAQYAEIPEALVRSVAKAESAFHTDAVSKKGALGVMQLMPATAAGMNADARDPKQNVYAGALYLRELLIKYHGEVAKALAAYNAGPGAVEKYHGVPPYAETRNYVNRVIGDYVRDSGAGASQ